MKSIVVSNTVWKRLSQEKLDSGAATLNEVIAKKLGIIGDKEVIGE